VKKLKRALTLIMVSLVVNSANMVLLACSEKASSYTVDEHVQRISARLEAKGLGEYRNGERIQDFEVYPLYNEEDQVKCFLIEYEPYGFRLVFLRDQLSWWKDWIGLQPVSMYRLSGFVGWEGGWYPYTYQTGSSLPHREEDKIYFYDENNVKISYRKSPYYISNNQAEKKYLIINDMDEGYVYGGEYIFAVKKAGEYVNLISGQTFCPDDRADRIDQPTIYMSYIAKKVFDL